MSILPIIVYGNGELFKNYFQAITSSFGEGSFSTLIHLAILMAGVTVIYCFIMQRDLIAIMRWFGLFYLSVYILFLPKLSVQIIDRVNQDKIFVIENVPLGLAAIASFSSVIGDSLTQLIEKNINLPAELHYTKTGMLSASRLFISVSQFQISDMQFNENLKSYLKQCVCENLLSHQNLMNDLLLSPHVWDDLKQNISQTKAFIYNNTVTNCHQGAAYLTDDWDKVIKNTITVYSRSLFPSAEDSSMQNQLLEKNISNSYQYLLKNSETTQDIIQQHLIVNAMKNFTFYSSRHYSIGTMLASWLPELKSILEAILYGAFIFTLLLSVFPSGVFFLKNYIYIVLWIQLWSPLNAIINFMLSNHAQLHSLVISTGVLSLQSMPMLLKINSELIELSGYLALMVPVISALLVCGIASIVRLTIDN